MSTNTLHSSSTTSTETKSNKVVFLETIKQFEEELQHLQVVISAYRVQRYNSIQEVLNFKKK